MGHIARKCPTGPEKAANRWVESEKDPDQEEAGEGDLPIFHLTDKQTSMNVQLTVEGQPFRMEVDTGAAVSLITEKAWKAHIPHLQLRKSAIRLRAYTGNQIPVVGEARVDVKYQDQQSSLTLYVVHGDGPKLVGRDWLRKIRLDWKALCMVVKEETSSPLTGLLEQYAEVFADELGTTKGTKAKLQIRPEAPPKFCKARPVPFALKNAIEEELDALEKKGVLERVDHSEWATPVVAVPKGDGHIRLCWDYKVTLNPALEIDQYPLPKPEELFATLSGGKYFSKLDLKQAYTQMLLEEKSREYATVNTHRGLYGPTRLLFGVASAPALFQKTMDMILQGMEGVICYIDDILVTRATTDEHLQRLKGVLQRLQEHGLRLKKNKCSFLQKSVEYLGHRVDAEGVHPLEDKVAAILKAPIPRNVSELRSFMGLLYYYGKFIPNLADLLHPLNQLLQAGKRWKWTSACNEAFQKAKEKLVTAPVLMHFDANLPLRLAGDASSYGIEAVISHVLPDGTERPIAFASRTLTGAEQNYAQLEKEALSLVYGVQRFHQYVYGRRFTLVTDHQPLLTVFGPKKGIPSLAAARLQQWAILLAAHTYDIEFKEHANADGLSRLPMKYKGHENGSSEVTLFNVAQIEALPVTAAQLERAMRQDPIMSRVWNYTRSGWPREVRESLKPFWNRKNELTVEGGCVLWGTRVLIPKKLHGRVLEELHRDHTGIVRMKAVARSYAWWPKMDREIEECAKKCEGCQKVQNKPAVAPLHPWQWPAEPWRRIHLDFAGPFRGRMFFLAMDAHSKWPEICEMSTSTSTALTIKELRKWFAAYGFPEQVVTDNGPQFSSEEFSTFMKMCGIKHLRCSPYHPASNGAVERLVQSFKRAMVAGEDKGVPLSTRLTDFLLSYRSTPHTTTNRAPCELFLKRQIRTRLTC
jgi:transposase InsO family protein